MSIDVGFFVSSKTEFPAEFETNPTFQCIKNQRKKAILRLFRFHKSLRFFGLPKSSLFLSMVSHVRDVSFVGLVLQSGLSLLRHRMFSPLRTAGRTALSRSPSDIASPRFARSLRPPASVLSQKIAVFLPVGAERNARRFVRCFKLLLLFVPKTRRSTHRPQSRRHASFAIGTIVMNRGMSRLLQSMDPDKVSSDPNQVLCLL